MALLIRMGPPWEKGTRGKVGEKKRQFMYVIEVANPSVLAPRTQILRDLRKLN